MKRRKRRMTYAYQPDAWQSLYMAVASATAALTGLLFISLSLNLHTILTIPAYRARARETLGTMLCLLVLSVLLLIPGQDRRVLGVELIAGSLATAMIGITLQIRTLGRITDDARGHWAARLVVLNLGTFAALVAGVSLIVGQFGGLFWLVLTVLIYLLWALNNAWRLVVQVAEKEE